MTLSERITALRTARGLSQEALAQRLGVSRQSISKWETGASTPELDKLTALADLFGLTLDELVRGEAIPTPEPTPDPAAPTGTIPSCKIAGWLLLALGGLCAILALALHPGLLILAVVLLLYGILCLTIRRHTGLTIAWVTFLPLAFLSPTLTPAFFRGDLANTLTILCWLGLLLTILSTVRMVRKK